MSKDVVFTMKIEPELRDRFMAAAGTTKQSASQIVRDLMKEFIERQNEAQEYKEFLQRKIEKSRESIRAGRLVSSEDVKAEFAKRAEMRRKIETVS